MSQAGLWDFTVGIPVVIVTYIGRRRQTIVAVPKPGRCIKHNHHGVFPVGLTQDCGSPSFHCLFLFCVFFVYAVHVMSPSLNVLESIFKKKYQHIY